MGLPAAFGVMVARERWEGGVQITPSFHPRGWLRVLSSGCADLSDAEVAAH